jgi:peptidyl-prolyl cis-trans isomerase C
MACLILVIGFACEAIGAATDDRVATVNGNAVSRQELDRAVGNARMQNAMRGVQVDPKQLEQEAMDSLINLELLYQEARKEGITADATEIDERLKMVIQRFPSEDEFKKAMENMGLTAESVKDKIARGLMVQRLVEERIGKNATVSEEEIKVYYKDHPKEFLQPEQVRASHILVKVEPGPDDAKKAEARKKIQEIQGKVKGGEDFAELAKNNSDCPSKANGGDLGYFSRGKMVKPFEEAAFVLEVGKVSDVVETSFGYHLIKVTDKQQEKTLAMETVKDRLEQTLKSQKIQDAVKEHVDKLKKEAKIEIFLP